MGALANAEIYCLALGNIYSDPNYHNLNHWSILQTLARKGVYVTEPTDAQLTETTLIQTNPLKIVCTFWESVSLNHVLFFFAECPHGCYRIDNDLIRQRGIDTGSCFGSSAEIQPWPCTPYARKSRTRSAAVGVPCLQRAQETYRPRIANGFEQWGRGKVPSSET